MHRVMGRLAVQAYADQCSKETTLSATETTAWKDVLTGLWGRAHYYRKANKEELPLDQVDVFHYVENLPYETNKVRNLRSELHDEFKNVSDGYNGYHILTDDTCMGDDSKLYFS